MPLFGQVKQEGALYISFCNQSHMYLQPDRDGQGALVRFETAGEDFLMHINGGDLWDKVVQIAIDGRSQYPNLPLQPAGQNPAE